MGFVSRSEITTLDYIMPKPEWYSDGLQFACTQCGNCCTGPPGYVQFNEDEAKAIAAFIGISVPEFRRRFTHKKYGTETLNEHRTSFGYDCEFLTRDEQTGRTGCSIYSVRPQQCRTWPFWSENLKSDKAWERTKRSCPGAGRGKLYPIEQIRILRDTTPEL